MDEFEPTRPRPDVRTSCLLSVPSPCGINKLRVCMGDLCLVDLRMGVGEYQHLRQLRCEHCDIGEKSARTLAQLITNATTLNKIYMKGCMMMSPYCASTLAEEGLHKATALEYLNLHWSNLDDSSIANLISALTDLNHLTEIDLSGNLCRGQGMQAIARLLETTTSLTRLRLREQCVEEDDPLDISPLLPVLASSTLTYLDLSVNKLDDDDMFALAEGFGSPPHCDLQSHRWQLDLRSNGIGDSGVEALTRLPLRKIWLQENAGITSAGAWAILEATAARNVCLEYIGLPQIYEDFDHTLLEYYASVNWGGKRILQSVRHASLWAPILERAGNCDDMVRSANILYFFLRHGSIIWSS